MMWIILSLLSALLIAFSDIIAKSFFRKKVLTPMQLNFSFSFFVALFVFIFFSNKITFNLGFTMFGLVLVKVIFLVTFNILYLSLLDKHDVSKVVPLNNLSPIMLIMLSSIFLNEAISLINLLGIFVIIFSTYYLEIVVENHHKDKPHKTHKIYFKEFDLSFAIKILVMLIVVSACAVADKIILKTVDVYSNIAFTYTLMALIVMIFLIRNKTLSHTFKVIAHNPIFLIQGAFVLFSTIFILQALALPAALTSLVIPLRRTSTLMAAFIGGFLFHEKHMKEKLGAVGFMLLGIVLIAL